MPEPIHTRSDAPRTPVGAARVGGRTNSAPQTGCASANLDRGLGGRDLPSGTASVEVGGGRTTSDPHCRSASSSSANQKKHVAPDSLARAENLNGGQCRSEVHTSSASIDRGLGRGRGEVDALDETAPVGYGVGQGAFDTQRSHADAMLQLAADSLDDLERVRIATKNRVRALCDVYNANGSAEEQKMSGLVAALEALEHQAELELRRRVREHPYGPWIKQAHGVGEKQGARLLAAIGDPYIRPDMYDEDRNLVEPERPRRGPAELWAYCGYAPEQKRQKGTKSNWNATAKMRAFLCAESCMKTPGSPYREVYLSRRAHTAETQPEWTAGHSHNDALRIVAKEILKDMWKWGRATFPANSVPGSPAPRGL